MRDGVKPSRPWAPAMGMVVAENTGPRPSRSVLRGGGGKGPWPGLLGPRPGPGGGRPKAGRLRGGRHRGESVTVSDRPRRRGSDAAATAPRREDRREPLQRHPASLPGAKRFPPDCPAVPRRRNMLARGARSLAGPTAPPPRADRRRTVRRSARPWLPGPGGSHERRGTGGDAGRHAPDDAAGRGPARRLRSREPGARPLRSPEPPRPGLGRGARTSRIAEALRSRLTPAERDVLRAAAGLLDRLAALPREPAA